MKERIWQVALSACSGIVSALLLVLAIGNYAGALTAEQDTEARGVSTTRFTSAVKFQENVTADRDLAVTGDITVDDLTVGDDLTVTDALSAASLTVGGYAGSGAVRFGSASNVISGTTIAHGFATTPTVFLIQNALIQAATFTQTLYAYGCNVTSCTVGLTQGSVVTVTTAAWMAGK